MLMVALNYVEINKLIVVNLLSYYSSSVHIHTTKIIMTD